MLRSLLIGFMLLAFALSGCTDAPDDEGDDPGDGTGSDVGGGFDSGDGNFTGGGNASFGEPVVLLDYPDAVNGTETITVSWSVDLAEAGASGNASDGNGTGGGVSGNTSGEIEETGLAYGFTSIMAPSGPDDYDNVTGVANNTTSPGEFEASFSVEGDGTSLFIRAYAVSGGEYYWSEEAELNYTAGEGGAAGDGAAEEIVIKSGTGGLAQFARFDPSTLTIDVGQSVVWNNTDGGTHTIEITGPDFEHSTGALSKGDVSDPVVFLVAGEYEFECTTHSTMNSGTITVKEA